MIRRDPGQGLRRLAYPCDIVVADYPVRVSSAAHAALAQECRRERRRERAKRALRVLFWVVLLGAGVAGGAELAFTLLRALEGTHHRPPVTGTTPASTPTTSSTRGTLVEGERRAHPI